MFHPAGTTQFQLRAVYERLLRFVASSSLYPIRHSLQLHPCGSSFKYKKQRTPPNPPPFSGARVHTKQMLLSQLARRVVGRAAVVQCRAVAAQAQAVRMYSTEDHSEILNAEREAMPYDIVIVGAG